MKLINTEEFKDKLARLAKQHDHISFAVAWASHGGAISEAIYSKRKK